MRTRLLRCTAMAAASLLLLLAMGRPTAAAAATQDGSLAYLVNCASCHGESMGGGIGPRLKGPEFHAKWAAQGKTALFDYISHQMPKSSPGTLRPEAYAEIANFLARRNQLPSPGIAALLASVKAPGAARSEADQRTESGGIGAAAENRDAQYVAAMAARGALLNGIKPVDEAGLRQPPAADWVSWRAVDEGTGHSALDQINRGNVRSLTLAWSRTLPMGTNEVTPLVHDGVMFLNSAGTILALDAGSGDMLWKFERPVSVSLIGPPVTQPKGMAMFENSLYVPTSDNHMLALDLHSGRLLWDHLITGMHKSLRITAGPIVAHGKVIQGMSGCAGSGEPGGCFIVGLDGKTGEELWRFHTVAHDGEPGGNTWNGAPLDKRVGGSVWSSGSYNAEDNLVYFGTGQTYHIATLMFPDPEPREENSALYTDTTLALNPDTGKLVWHYQHMAREVWDLDWAFERVIATIDIGGKPQKVVMTMGKLGILDVLDARTGKYLFSYDVGLQNLVKSIDPVTGWKTTDPALEPDPKQPKFICPFAIGVRNWPASSYDPASHLLYVAGSDNCMDFVWNNGEDWDITYAIKPRPDGDGNYGWVTAINLQTRKAEWTRKHRAAEASAVLSTEGGLVFEGGRDRVFRASDSLTGQSLWQARLDNVPSSTPITFAAGGRQYIAVTTGGGNPNDVLHQTMTPEFELPVRGMTLLVFSLPQDPAATSMAPPAGGADHRPAP